MNEKIVLVGHRVLADSDISLRAMNILWAFKNDNFPKKMIKRISPQEQEASYRLASIVASSEDAIVSKTLQGIITSWNEAAERMFGYKASEIIGKSIITIIPQHLRNQEEDIIRKITRGERIEHFQTERQRKDGSFITVSLTISPIKNDRGKVIGASKIARDITKQVQAEKEKSDFLSMASHELKTPLTSMKLFLELLTRELSTTELQKAKYLVGRIYNQTNQLVELTNDLLDVSRIETGKLKLNKELFELENLIYETVESIQPSTRNHLLKIIKHSKVKIVADRYRIFQVVINLLTNAIKYSPGKNNVHIAINATKKEVIVSVRDYGIGINKDQQEKIFERLYQVTDPTEKTYPGLGLGLYISKEIIARHNGKIWVKSKKGKGSTFYFSLPLK